MCDASLAALERLLMTPRHKFGPSHEWLANWNFPPPKAWAEAQRLAAERSNQNCADSALVLPNLRLYTAPCVTQCAAALRVGAAHARRCVCRACNSTEARATFGELASAWLALHPPPRGADSPCAATSATLDYPAERCLPYIFPLKSVADECAHAPA